MTVTEMKVIDLFKRHGIHHEWFRNTKTGEIEVNVKDGDWKHEHLFLDWAMGEIGLELVRTRPSGEPTGGDWYSAWRVYRAKGAA